MSNQIQSFLLPYAPKLDKIAALYGLLTFVVKQPLAETEVLFYNVDLPLPPNAIDVDARSDYKSSGFRSATQRVLDDEPYKGLNLRAIPGMNHFAACFDKNNATGALKNRFASNLFNLVNDWPRVGHNVPRDQHMMEVIEMVFGIFDLYFMAASIDVASVEAIENPFCMSGIKQLQKLVDFPLAEAMNEELEYLFERTSKADDLTRKRADLIEPELLFQVPTLGALTVGGGVFRTDDRRLTRWLFVLRNDLNVIVIKHRSGNVVIMARGQQDFSALAKALNELEPGLWHHETRYKSPFLANGGETRSVTATALTASKLRDLIVEHFRYTTRTQDMIVR